MVATLKIIEKLKQKIIRTMPFYNFQNNFLIILSESDPSMLGFQENFESCDQDDLGLQESGQEAGAAGTDCRNLHFHRPCRSPFFWNPAPLMQNYMIKSVKMTKKSILRDQFSWKVRTFAPAFRKGCRSFCCSTFRERTATSNKDINEQTYYRRSMRSIAQTTPLGNRGCRRPVHGNGTGSALSLCPYR